MAYRFTQSGDGRSEDLEAPGQRAPREQGIGAHDGSLPALLDAQRFAELRERDGAEIGRAKRRDVEREVGILVGSLACAGFEPPPAVVPVADRVAHLEHERGTI